MVSIKSIVDKVAENTGLTKCKAKEAFDACIAAMMDGIIEDGCLRLSNFGTFTVKEVPEKSGVMPTNGQEWYSPAHNVVKFKPSKNYIDALNQ